MSNPFSRFNCCGLKKDTVFNRYSGGGGAIDSEGYKIKET